MDEREINCLNCNTRYAEGIERFSGGSMFYNQKTHHNACPSCAYNRDLEMDIAIAIRENTALTLRNSRISINSEEISGIILKIIKAYWPKKGHRK
jgi:hypothetical protein